MPQKNLEKLTGIQDSWAEIAILSAGTAENLAVIRKNWAGIAKNWAEIEKIRTIKVRSWANLTMSRKRFQENGGIRHSLGPAAAIETRASRPTSAQKAHKR